MSAAPVAQDKGTQAYLPDFCAAATVFVVVVIAELIAILLTLAAHRPQSLFLVELARVSLFVQWLALLSCGVMCMFRSKLESTGKTRAFVISFLVLAALCLAVAELAWQIPVRIVDNKRAYIPIVPPKKPGATTPPPAAARASPGPTWCWPWARKPNRKRWRPPRTPRTGGRRQRPGSDARRVGSGRY